MSAFDSPLSSLVAGISAVFGEPVTWSSHNSLILPYSIVCVVDLGESIERQARGYFAVLKNLNYSDLSNALNGSTDLTTLEGDTVTLTTPAWAAGVYRVQNVCDPDYAGTVQVELRKPKQ
jgi:hypothetical protein